MSIKIVTDSTITIEPGLVEELDITVVPLTILIDGVLYKDTDLNSEEFIEKMQSSKTLPKTSQPPVGVFAEVYDDLGADGSQVISIHLTKILSGTVEAARQASNLTNTDVTVIDSEYIDQALKYQVVEAARLAKDGATKEEILASIENVKNNTELFIGVATLENLVKGGRIGRATGMVGNLLNFKIILQLTSEELAQVVKGRGNKTFTKWVDEYANSLEGRNIKEISISHAGYPPIADYAKEKLQPYVEKEIISLPTNSTIATHAGMGAFAVMTEFE
ncbi:EDD domain protein [Floricoccus tropicus]|uniref:EDD domain protein n=1 Tax=Floricoccus tropicus TaxID=1859473 RepID=A0A1E8GQG5_9LACT|nr:DegV family protein [Floricoccus tropicus]OFI50482.1 EDD domain protein [Floricoccus tropicus]